MNSIKLQKDGHIYQNKLNYRLEITDFLISINEFAYYKKKSIYRNVSI